jgi:hypothetical protein
LSLNYAKPVYAYASLPCSKFLISRPFICIYFCFVLFVFLAVGTLTILLFAARIFGHQFGFCCGGGLCLLASPVCSPSPSVVAIVGTGAVAAFFGNYGKGGHPFPSRAPSPPPPFFFLFHFSSVYLFVALFFSQLLKAPGQVTFLL